jgi:hypothetical protein
VEERGEEKGERREDRGEDKKGEWRGRGKEGREGRGKELTKIDTPDYNKDHQTIPGYPQESNKIVP